LKTYNHFLLIVFILFGCAQQKPEPGEQNEIKTGAQRVSSYLPLLKNKRTGLVVNHTSVIGKTHLVDTLIELGVEVDVVFGPEHGFRGQAADGEKISNDSTEDYQIISLYGKNRKPSKEDLAGIDIVVFDIQDVGTRFYTYISTMHYVMEACAENGIPVIVLDRPNPNGFYIDGPVREPEFSSFVGMHPIPVVHGLTVGELANMINKEGWLANNIKCNLTVIENEFYTHKDRWPLKIYPSPNLPNDISVGWYPSLCFFEGTIMSIGRGTYHPFQVIGYPDSTFGKFTFTPVSIEGMSLYPKFENETCFGIDLQNVSPPAKVDLSYLIDFYSRFDDKDAFFKPYFNTLAGTDQLMAQIKQGLSQEEIGESWLPALDKYKELRKKYLLYPDFE